MDLRDGAGYSPRLSCDTTYTVAMVERLLRMKGPEWLCDEISREQDPGYVEADLRHAVFAFVSPEELAGRRLLDFGCGGGASTAILARLLPETEIVGIDLSDDLLELARMRADHFGTDNLTFRCSPDPQSLPADIGTFDYIMLSAVWEHLLPEERRSLVPRIWALLRPGGVLFLNQTPHQRFVVEGHTTGLPLINYLPDRLALLAARRLSRRVTSDVEWSELLRNGIRGGTEEEVLGVLSRAGSGRALPLPPTRLGMTGAADLQYAIGVARGRRPEPLLRLVRTAYRTIGRATGRSFTPILTMAVVRSQLPGNTAVTPPTEPTPG